MTRKPMTAEEWVQKARSVWGDKYDYADTDYQGSENPVTIYCPEHDIYFTQSSTGHLRGSYGCDECSPTRMTSAKFRKRADEVWDNRWDYSKTEYKGSKVKVVITCKKHGEFKQDPHMHLRGQVGCPSCSGRGISTKEFIRKSKAVWGEDAFTYEHAVYTKSHGKVTITCVKHGDFEQVAKTHLLGANGCPHCAPTAGYTQEVFLSKVREKWGDRWDLSKIDYNGTYVPVILGCPEHGEFTQIPNSLLNGRNGCPQCNGKGITLEDKMGKMVEVWGDRWDYSNTKYLPNDTKIDITCRQHGPFKQLLHDHIRGFVGCPSCQSVQTSKSELEVVEFVKSLGFDDTIQRATGLLPSTRQELDVYVPSKKIAFEYNGCYYHSDKFRAQGYHYDKWLAAKQSGIRLLQIWEDDWILRNDIVREHICQVLGVSDLPKVFARKTEVVMVPSPAAKEFFNRYHIQGAASGSYYVGLSYGGEVVALAAFRKQGEDYVLSRYATSANVVGGHSKIVSWFEKNVSYRNLITFADLTFSEGDLYRSTGWNEDKLLKPDYSYLVDNVRQHKFGYRINRFKSDPKLRYVEGMTEKELADLNGLLRVYDAGKIRFVKPHPDNAEERI